MNDIAGINATSTAAAVQHRRLKINEDGNMIGNMQAQGLGFMRECWRYPGNGRELYCIASQLSRLQLLKGHHHMLI